MNTADMKFDSIILNTDSYKASHFQVLPEGMDGGFSYIESRGGLFPKTIFFGLQAFIKQYLLKPITKADIDAAEFFFKLHGEPFNREGWEYILSKYDGYIPVKIRAVREGMLIPVKNVLVTVECLDKNCAWVASYIETSILRGVWYPTTVATQSWHIRQVILNALGVSGDEDSIDFKCHDFGARGVSSFESAGLGGMAHLVSFKGTDTISGILYAMKYYSADPAATGFSIPATEHSVSTAYGREGELDYYNAVIDKFAPHYPIYANVIDTYSLYNAVQNLIGTQLKDKIIASGSTMVLRPDSGDPERVVLDCLDMLNAAFGSTVNAKGYKVLNNVRIIQGDGVNYNSIKGILANIELHGYSADNVAFGSGGALLQSLNRDTQKFAMKASWISINGEGKDIFKDPVTDHGKKSKTGRLNLLRNKVTGEFETVSNITEIGNDFEEMLVTVYDCGKLVTEYTFEEIRKVAAAQ